MISCIIFYTYSNYLKMQLQLTYTHYSSSTRIEYISRAASVQIGNKWYIYGGCVNACDNCNTLWVYDFSKSEWSIEGADSKGKSKAPPLDSHTMCYYEGKDNKQMLIIFGGFVGDKFGEYWNQVVTYDITAGSWELPYTTHIKLNNQNAPKPRGGQSAVVNGEYMYVFGGTNGDQRYNDLWKYNITNKTWKEIQAKNPPLVKI